MPSHTARWPTPAFWRLATPLWIPQLVMAVGTVVLAIAFADDFILELRGKRQAHHSGEMLRNE